MSYVCKSCFRTHDGYQGRCEGCGRWNTLLDREVARDLPISAREGAGASIELWETPLQAVNRALGGLALSAAGVMLLGGEPGCGKSTLAIQLCGAVERGLYLSSEETQEAVCARGVRVGVEEVQVIATRDLDRVYQAIESMGRGGLCVVDSLQGFTAGRLNEAKEGIAKLCDTAKASGCSLLIVNHVTRSEDLAGPKIVEHLVDTVAVLSVFGQAARVLKCKGKNRFGRTEVAGWMRMGPEGLYDAGPELLLSGQGQPGRVVAIDQEGMPREVQAKRRLGVDKKKRLRAKAAELVLGLSSDRARLVAMVLETSPALWMLRADGDELDGDEAADLAMLVAMASAQTGRPVPDETVVWGQLSLDGRVLASDADHVREDSARDMGLARAVGGTWDEVLEGLGLGDADFSSDLIDEDDEDD